MTDNFGSVNFILKWPFFNWPFFKYLVGAGYRRQCVDFGKQKNQVMKKVKQIKEFRKFGHPGRVSQSLANSL